MTNLESAQTAFNKADKLLRWGVGFLIFFGLVVFTMTIVQLYQVQNQIAKNQTVNAKASNDRFARYTAENEEEHAKTQAYVKCIADTLLQPIDTRQPIDFSNCNQP